MLLPINILLSTNILLHKILYHLQIFYNLQLIISALVSKGLILKNEIRSHSKISLQIAEDNGEKPDTADNRNCFESTVIRISQTNNTSSNLNKGNYKRDVFGYLISINIDFCDFVSPFSLKFRLSRYIKHSRQCLTTLTNTSKFVTNTLLHVVFYFQLPSRCLDMRSNTVSLRING